MLRLRRLTTAAACVLALVTLRPSTVRGEDAPHASPPARSPEDSAALAKAHDLNAQMASLYEQGNYEEATARCREALAIRERVLGKDDIEVATNLNSLTTLLQAQGSYAEARPLCERALEICERVRGKDHPDVATSLNNFAALRKAEGSYAEARSLLERALAISERAHGKDHIDVAATVNNLASVLKSLGAYREARPLFERALAIRERALGKDHFDVATSLNNLALLAKTEGKFAEARPLYERALAIIEKTRGRDHPLVAVALNNIAELLRSGGAYREARPLYERALQITETGRGKDHPMVALSLNNLAELLCSFGAFAEARPMFERALAINEKAFGPDHPDVATSLDNLAQLLKRRGDYSEAQALAERALAIREKALGSDHPDLAASLTGLAALYRGLKDFHGARAFSERAVTIREKALGPDHPDVAESLNNLALIYEDQMDYRGARPLYERALAITEKHARAQLFALTARQRLGLLRSTRYRLNNWLAFAPHAGLSGYAEVLRFRGLVARAETAERILSRRSSGEARLAQEALEIAQGRAARLANEVPASRDPAVRAAWQKAYAEASAERERLTIEVTGRTAPLRTALERLEISLPDVQARLLHDEVLVDFLRVGDIYLAWVVRASGAPARIRVGEANAIEAASKAFVQAITERRNTAGAGAALRSLAWAPVEATLGAGVTRVVVCPDAALAAVPFAALPGSAQGTRLIDDVRISYVMSAQDLVPWKDAPPAGTGAVLVGGVDYDRAKAGGNEGPSAGGTLGPEESDRAPRGGMFPPIPETKVEVEGLRERFGSEASSLLLGAEATEQRLRAAVKGKRFVHIATHGFAREDLLAGLSSRKIDVAFTSADVERQLSAGHDPMLLSGLAMAGANPRDGGRGEDGILTALEASYLDLDGVDLVTLSACETARGTAESGEGVQGLVQAFQMAGARRVVASLWKVDDEGTRRLMDGLYERMLRRENPLPPAEALREASIALRDGRDASGTSRFADPIYWSAFVAYGR